LSEPAKDLLVEKGWDPAMGARPLRRAIQRYIEDPLADFVLRSELKPGATVLVEPGETDSGEQDVKLSILEPVPAGVGGEGDGGAHVPCVVLAHGWTGIREARLDAYAERFAVAGMAALVFDYRHFGASEGEPRQLLDIRRQLEDWAAAIAYARTLEGVDPERIALWGSSFSGGHVVETAACDRRIGAGVGQVPFVGGLADLPGPGP